MFLSDIGYFVTLVAARAVSDDAAPGGAMSGDASRATAAGALWFCGVVAALLVLFAAGLRLRIAGGGLAALGRCGRRWSAPRWR